MTRGGAVRFAVPAEVAYDYLVDPLNRPQWQSSLRAVAFPGPAPRGGQPPLAPGLVWEDITWPGLRPRMELTVAERPHRWTEVGRWRGVSAELTLWFEPDSAGCAVRAEFEIGLPGLLRPLRTVLIHLARSTVRSDLRRADRLLTEG